MTPGNVATTPTASLIDRPVSAYTSATKKLALDANEAEVALSEGRTKARGNSVRYFFFLYSGR